MSSRTDAITILGNEIVCKLFELPENCIAPDAPTQFPFLWDTPDLEWVQYISSMHSPLGRNIGQATAVFAEQSLDTSGVISTANLPNLRALEKLVKTLRAPAWPSTIFGAIDTARAMEGAQLYAVHCAGCHTLDPQPRTAPNIYGATFAKVNFATPLSALGTDPTAALTFVSRRANPGPFRAAAEANGLIGPDGKAPVAALLVMSSSSIIQRFFASIGATPQQKLEYLDYREPRAATPAQLMTYKARSLKGVAFTAPYLHNGSVQSMYQLLLPPGLRLKQFFVGSTRFDPTLLGLSPLPSTNSMLFDTTLKGNSNSGHNYGTALSHTQRMSLIEYLKTLQ